VLRGRGPAAGPPGAHASAHAEACEAKRSILRRACRHTHTHAHARARGHAGAFMQELTLSNKLAHMHTPTHVCMQAVRRTHTRSHTRMHAHIHTHIRMNTYTQTIAHTLAHTRKHTLDKPVHTRGCINAWRCMCLEMYDIDQHAHHMHTCAHICTYIHKTGALVVPAMHAGGAVLHNAARCGPEVCY